MSKFRRRLMMATPAKPPEPASDGYVWAYYVSTADNETVTIFKTKTGFASTMYVDGVSATTAASYTFAEAGIHLVRVKRSTSGDYRSNLENNQFQGCTKLTELYLPEGIQQLLGTGSYGCCRGCTALTKVLLPSTTNLIQNRAFYGDTALQTFVIRATTPPTIGETSFYNAPNTAKFYVPYSSDHSVLSAYQTAQYWSARSSQMYELNPDGSIPTE